MENNLENVQESNMVDSNLETTQTEVATETKEEKLYTKDEMQDLLDKSFNKRFAQMKTKFEEEKQEAERLAKMSEAEKAKHEFEKEKADLDERIRKFEVEKLGLEVAKELSNRSLPSEFSKYLVGTTAEESINNIKEFEDLFQKAVERKTGEDLKGSTPSIANSANPSVTKEQFKKMSIFQKADFAKEYPELYKQFK